jgi:hypothetical protein
MRIAMLSLVMILGACGGKSTGGTSPGPAEASAPDAMKATCCDPKQNPGGIEGAHCCADGTWRGDIGNGGSEECQEAGGDGAVCPE